MMGVFGESPKVGTTAPGHVTGGVMAQSEIVGLLLRQSDSINIVHELLTSLEERLRPVIVEVGVAGNKPTETNPVLSPFGQKLADHTENIEHMQHRIRVLLACLSI